MTFVPERRLDVTDAPPTAPAATRSSGPRPFRIVAIVSSMGGIPAVGQILATLPADFPLPVLVLQHLSAEQPSRLAEYLNGHCSLKVQAAENGAVIETGGVYVATPGQHLTVSGLGRLTLSGEALVNFVRPSADVLLKSIAGAYADQAIVVVLTGRGVDGGAGAGAVEDAGGRVMAQDRVTSFANGMPAAAILATDMAQVLPLNDIAAALVALVGEGVRP